MYHDGIGHYCEFAAAGVHLSWTRDTEFFQSSLAARVNTAIKTKPWKGLLASLVLSGAGQFLSGARRRGLIWFLIACVLPFFLLSLYSSALVPAKAGISLLGVSMIAWLVMLYDAYRPITRLRWWGWLLLILFSFAFSELYSRFAHRLFYAYHVPTNAMGPTISNGDDVLVSRSAYWFREPQRGDLIVFNTSGIKGIHEDQTGKEVLFLKRLIGLPNDVVEIGGGNIWINKTKMEFGDPIHPIEYRNVRSGKPLRSVESYLVPAGEYFVLGDNSAHSYDSRYWGTIRRSAIYGKVTKIYWPWDRMATPQ
jgi:signal peptidase I